MFTDFTDKIKEVGLQILQIRYKRGRFTDFTDKIRKVGIYFTDKIWEIGLLSLIFFFIIFIIIMYTVCVAFIRGFLQ